ncbi:MAG TPA: hypothetical protein VHZ24_02075 [Pirellulales bacterium]|jgi:hypothetical protein|nr:hypothetical protein [Pirellulales bacterium]
MFFVPQSIDNLASHADLLNSWRSGVIEARAGRFDRLSRRRLRRRATRLERRTVGETIHRFASGDVCRLYYYAPRACPGFLALDYVLSHRDASLSTFRAALTALDAIARLRGEYAIVCDASNLRISDRLLERWGWEPHATWLPGRNFIKRLGEYEEADRHASAKPVLAVFAGAVD